LVYYSCFWFRPELTPRDSCVASSQGRQGYRYITLRARARARAAMALAALSGDEQCIAVC